MSTVTAVTITIDNTVFTLGKLNLAQLKRYRELIFAKVADIPKRDPVQFMFDVVPIIADSIRAGGGAEISEEWLEEHLDIATVYDCFHQVFEANNLVLVPSADGASGETPVQSTAAV